MRRLSVAVAGVALVVAGCGGGSAPQDSAEPGGVALVGAQLIDGSGGAPVADSVVVVRDGRIEAAGPRDATPVPDGAETIDVTGKTIMPGLVNLHVHYREGAAEVERQFDAQLHYGVTTSRSIGSDDPARVEFLLGSAGRSDAPRVFTAGMGFSRPGGFNAAGRNAPETEEEARELVRAQTALGVHFIKMWVNEVAEPDRKITPEMRTAIVDEALQNGALPVAHIDDEVDGRQLVEAGLRDFLHSTVLTFGPGAGAPVDDPEPSAEFIQMCVDNGVSFTPTLSIVQNRWHFAEHPELLEDTDLRAAFERFNPGALATWDDASSRSEVVDDPGFEDRKAAFRQLLDFVKTMHDAGVAVAMGNDAGTPNVPFGWGMHHEMELYVEAGLTPMEAIVAATATGAARMPPVGQADFGTLEAGKTADLIVLNSDPLDDIRNTLDIDRVMRLGEWVDRSGFAADAMARGPASPHTVTTTKFTVDDATTGRTFYEDLIGMPELRRYVDEGRLVEPFMGWSENGRMGLLAYTEKEAVGKTSYPVSVVFLPDLDEVVARFEAAGQPIQEYSGEATGGIRLALVTDPSGNVIELVEREGPPAVGGARLIVEDRAAAEEFFVRIFGAEAGQRIKTDAFDEVFMNVGEGMFVALFEPTGADAAPQPKSDHPVVAIYSTDFDTVLERVKAGGLRVRQRSENMFFADDPSGNVVEVVRQRPR